MRFSMIHTLTAFLTSSGIYYPIFKNMERVQLFIVMLASHTLVTQGIPAYTGSIRS